jgi:membrane-bound acyltransferase YfiQ involved in biofilm formation
MLIAALLVFSAFVPTCGLINKPDAPLDRTTTQCIKGAFVLLIIFSHMQQYRQFSFYPDAAFGVYLGQTITAPFLFFSGYGILESIKTKPDYSKYFFISRFFKTLLDFWVLLLPYVVLALIEKTYSISDFLLSLTGLRSLGNSDWFVFCILFFYFICSFSFLSKKKTLLIGSIILTLSTVIYSVVLVYFGKEDYWVDTAFCFAVGVWVSFFKDKILTFTNKKINFVLASLLFLMLFLALVYFVQKTNGVLKLPLEIAKNSSFVVLVLLFCLKINNKSKLFELMGKASFSIYILQRFPMIIASKYLQIDNALLFYLTCFLSAIVFGLLFQKLIDLINGIVITKLVNKIKIKHGSYCDSNL